MASNKKSKLDELLSQDVPQGPLRRGTGMHLSTDAPPAREEAAEPAPVHPVDAQTQERTIALSQERTNAIVRVNRGYKLREDLIKQCKRIALEEDRLLYEVMEEALEAYIERKKENASSQERTNA